MMPNDAKPVPDLKPIAVPRSTRLPRRATFSAWARFRSILQGSPTHSVELLSGLASLSIGIWLLLPNRVLHYDPLYVDVAQIADEWVWGVLLSGLGMTEIFVLLVDGRKWRAVLAFVQFVVWLMIWLLIGFSSHWRSPGVPAYVILAMMAGWVYIRLERDRRQPG